MKINYNGMELETIAEGYWPDGVTLVLHDGNITSREVRNVVCLKSGSVLRANGACTTGWHFWPILPPKPEPRRLTNREVHDLCQKGWSANYEGHVFGQHDYPVSSENEICDLIVKSLRAPNSDEWLEPTSDLLGVVK